MQRLKRVRRYFWFLVSGSRNARFVAEHATTAKREKRVDAYRRIPKTDEVNEIPPREFLEGIAANHRMEVEVPFYYPLIEKT